MTKEVLCPNCGARYNLGEETLGKKVRCGKCRQAFVAGGEPRPREEDGCAVGIQATPLTRPRAEGAAGRDRADEVLPVKAPAPRGSGLPIVAVVLACLALGGFVLCGAGGGGAWYFLRSRPPAAGPVSAPPAPPVAEANRPAAADWPPVNVPPAPRFRRPGFPPGFPGAAEGPPITNLNEAIDALRDNDPGRRAAGADWLSRAPRDEAKADAVSKALGPLVRDAQPNVFGHDAPRQAALPALKVWGTPANVPTLVEFLRKERDNHGAPVHMGEQLKDAMAALARIGDDRGVEGILPWVDDFFIGVDAERLLRQMGPKAEKGLVRHYDDPDDDDEMMRPSRFHGPGKGGKRAVVRRLLREIGAKPDVLVGQVAVDLKADDAGRRRLALEALGKLPLVEARRGEVSRALGALLEDADPNVSAAALKAARTWGTKENVPALIRLVESGQSLAQRATAMEALGAIKDERGAWPVARWLGDPLNGDTAEATIPKFGPAAEKVGLEHLKDADAALRLRAWWLLALVGAPANLPAMNAAAAKETDTANREAAATAIKKARQRQ